MNSDMCNTVTRRNWLMDQPEGCGNVVFTRTDGREIVIENVRIDSVSPVNEDGVNRDVIGVELFDKDETIFLPFIERWHFEYH